MTQAELISMAGPMSRNELVNIMDQLDLDPDSLAKLIGTARKTIWRWITDVTAVPRPAGMAIRFLARELGK